MKEQCSCIPDVLIPGTIDCTVANTAYCLDAAGGAGTIPVVSVVVQSDPLNSGIVKIGTAALRTIKLDRGESISLPIDNLNKIWVESSVAGDDVNFLGLG